MLFPFECLVTILVFFLVLKLLRNSSPLEYYFRNLSIDIETPSGIKTNVFAFSIAQKLGPALVRTIDELILRTLCLVLVHLICSIRAAIGYPLRFDYLALINLLQLPSLFAVTKLATSGYGRALSAVGAIACFCVAKLAEIVEFQDERLGSNLNLFLAWLPAADAAALGGIMTLSWVMTLARINKYSARAPLWSRAAQLAHLILLALPVVGSNLAFWHIDPCTDSIVVLTALTACSYFTLPQIDLVLKNHGIRDTKTLGTLFLYLAAESMLPSICLVTLVAWYTSSTAVPACTQWRVDDGGVIPTIKGLGNEVAFMAPLVSSVAFGGILVLITPLFSSSAKEGSESKKEEKESVKESNESKKDA